MFLEYGNVSKGFGPERVCARYGPLLATAPAIAGLNLPVFTFRLLVLPIHITTTLQVLGQENPGFVAPWIFLSTSHKVHGSQPVPSRTPAIFRGPRAARGLRHVQPACAGAALQVYEGKAEAPCCSVGVARAVLWMDEILHHFGTMKNQCL